MFGSKRKKIQVRSVEDYLKGEDARIPAAEATLAPSSARPAKAKPFVAQAIVILFMLALMLVAFSQLSKLRSDVAELRAGKMGDTDALRKQVAEIAAKLETSNRQVESLTASVEALQRDVQAERSLRARAEAAAAARRTAAPEKKRKPAGAGR